MRMHRVRNQSLLSCVCQFVTHYSCNMVNRKLKVHILSFDFNSFKSGVPFKGHRQTE